MEPNPKAAWAPVIDQDLCIGDKACVDACPVTILFWNDNDGILEVSEPEKCIDGCKDCADICPTEAILFPGRAA